LKRIPIVVNPAAGGGRLLKYRGILEATARAGGLELEWLPTERPGHGEQLARGAAEAGCPLVLAYGGDGTYNEVARGLLGSPTAMGVLPGGTTSVLAYELEVPRPASRALEALLDGHDRPMRVGRTSLGDLFLLMLSAGPDAVVVRNLPDGLKWLGGRNGVAAQAVREVLNGQPLPRLRATVGSTTIEGGWVIAGNARCYGGRYQATPGANPFDGELELVVQTSVGRRVAIPFALGIPLGRHVQRADVVRLGGARVTLEPVPATAEVPYQIDGDAVGLLPVEAWIEDETVTVRLPKMSRWSRDEHA
jgi:diacylglycerol kinase family enzyme